MRLTTLTAPAILAAITLASPSAASPTSERASGPKAAKFGQTGRPVRGVNLGGWFVLENWITPSFFLAGDLANKTVPDEWNYMTMTNNATLAKANLKQHWATWYTEDDFAQIAAAGLNTVRLPLPHWAFNAVASEPYQGVAQRPFIRQALTWAKQYNLDVVLDLHTAPGSQNGYDNSGHLGPITFTKSSTDIPRAIDALTKMVKWYVNDPTYGGVVKAIELVNEPIKLNKNSIPAKNLASFHKQAYTAIRNAVTSDALVSPTILISDAFVDVADDWDSMFPSSTYKAGTYVVDEHHYQAWAPWQGQSFDTQIQWFCGTGNPYAGHLLDQAKKRPVVVGEWSLGVGIGCTPYTDCADRTMADDIADNDSDAQNLFYRRFFEAQVSQYEKAAGWIFWAWKTESVAPWSYKDARIQGWIPANASDVSQRVFVPSTTSGVCASKNPRKALSFPALSS